MNSEVFSCAQAGYVYLIFKDFWFIYFMHLHVCLYVCIRTMCMPGAWGGQKGPKFPWNRSYGRL